MSERILSGNNACTGANGGSSCIETKKVYDSCRDKECVENIRVYLTEAGQCLLDRAINVKCRKTEIIWIYSDVEPVQFNRGYYSVDLKFFFRVTLDIFTGVGRPVQAEGLATFDKKVILFGSEGNARTFRSKYKFDEGDVQLWQKNNLPEAHIDVCARFLLDIHKNQQPFSTKKDTTFYINLLTMIAYKCKIKLYLYKCA